MNISKTRKRIAGIAAATLLAAGIGVVATTSVAGAAGKAPSAVTGQVTVPGVQAPPTISIAGTWFLTTDWGCDGSITGSFTQTFNADGTWTSTGHNGRWYQVGGVVVWTFNTAAGLSYSGNISGSWISGVQGYTVVNGIAPGCFGGRVNGVASVEEPTAGKVDPAIGK